MGCAELAQSPGSHTLDWSHRDLARVASPMYFMGLIFTRTTVTGWLGSWLGADWGRVDTLLGGVRRAGDGDGLTKRRAKAQTIHMCM